MALTLSFSAFSQTETKLHPAQLLQAGATNGQVLNFNTATGEWEPISVSTGTDDQTLSLSGNDLSIESGNTVDLSSVNTDAQDLSLSGNTLSLTGDGTSVDLSGYLDNTDAQDLSLSGNTLSLTGDGTTVNLAPYLDNTDDQTIDVFTLSSNTLSISLESDGEATKTVSLAPYLDNTDAQDLSLSGNTLSLTGDGTSVDLSSYLDNTDTQDLAYTAGTGLLSLTDGGSVSILVSAQYTEEVFTGLTTGNTVTIAGTLPSNRDGVVVSRGGLVQREGATADFTVSGSTLTFVARNFENGETVVIKYPN